MVDSFECKKWTLFTLCLVSIVLTMIITIVPTVIIDYAQPYTEHDAQYLVIFAFSNWVYFLINLDPI